DGDLGPQPPRARMGVPRAGVRPRRLASRPHAGRAHRPRRVRARGARAGDRAQRVLMRAAIAGAAGYAGGALLRILSGHPAVEGTQATSERLAGKRVDLVHPPLRGRTDLVFTARSELREADVVFSALRHGESVREIDRLRSLAPVVIDLGADFRL